MITITCQQCGKVIPNYSHYSHICSYETPKISVDVLKQLKQDDTIKDIYKKIHDLELRMDDYEAQKLTKKSNIVDKLRQKIIRQIDSVKQYGTDNSALIIMAYQNVLKWIAEMEDC